MVHSTPANEYLRNEILELQVELDLAIEKKLEKKIIDEIKNELEAKKNHFNDFYF